MSDFSFGPEPSWLTCACGAQTAIVPCWTCERDLDAKADAARERVLSGGSIPRRFDWAHLESAELPSRVKATRSFADIAKRVLASTRVIFTGASGTGKTSLACACLRERIPHGLFVSAMRIGTARIQHSAGDGEAAIVERAIKVPLLLLDEVGGEMKTATNAVKDVIFARYDADLPTWITTGFRPAQLVEMYGDGAARRLTEGVYVVTLGGLRP